jgi:hypothetical protein
MPSTERAVDENQGGTRSSNPFCSSGESATNRSPGRRDGVMRRWVTIGYLLPAVAGRQLFVVGCLGCEARIAEPGADGENAPAIDILSERQPAQSLHHSVIVHQHGQLVVSYVGNAVLVRSASKKWPLSHVHVKRVGNLLHIRQWSEKRRRHDARGPAGRRDVDR